MPRSRAGRFSASRVTWTRSGRRRSSWAPSRSTENRRSDTMTELGDRVIGMGRALVAELEEESPGFRALRDGELSREGYIDFLVQHHKYARISYEMMKTYARRMAESENKA